MLAFIFSQPKEVHVPGVAGMTVEEATEELKALKLDIGEIIEQNDEEIEEGNVIRTNPAADSTLKEANEVDLYISLGKKTVSVQNYEEKNYEEVRAELTEQGFTVERENKNHNFIPEGHVISQSIDAGDEVVPSESTILLTVSDGPEGHDLANFTGYSVEGVEKYADEHNLSVTITREPHESIPEGQVASQSPDAGSLVYNGSRISVVLSTGPEEPEIISFDRGITIEYVEPDNKNSKEDDEPQQDESSNEPNHIEIYVNDNENSYKNIYREFDIYENAVEIISFNVKEDETASYKVLRNGEKIIEKNDITPND